MIEISKIGEMRIGSNRNVQCHWRRFRTISFVNLKVLSARVFTLEGHPLDKESISLETPTKTEDEVVTVADKFGIRLEGDPKLVH